MPDDTLSHETIERAFQGVQDTLIRLPESIESREARRLVTSSQTPSGWPTRRGSGRETASPAQDAARP